MAGFAKEKVTSVHHWNDTLFSFKTSRDPSFRFKNGHFISHEEPIIFNYTILENILYGDLNATNS